MLFLTTNRVGAFDDAFMSRVHIQLYYPEFTEKEREMVWKTFTDKLQRERGDTIRLNIDAKEYIRGADMRAVEWNGREIRNGKLSLDTILITSPCVLLRIFHFGILVPLICSDSAMDTVLHPICVDHGADTSNSALQTAVALAEYDAEKDEEGKIVLTDTHLKAVVELSADFKKYLEELHSGNASKRAERKFERLDDYEKGKM